MDDFAKHDQDRIDQRAELEWLLSGQGSASAKVRWTSALTKIKAKQAARILELTSLIQRRAARVAIALPCLAGWEAEIAALRRRIAAAMAPPGQGADREAVAEDRNHVNGWRLEIQAIESDIRILRLNEECVETATATLRRLVELTRPDPDPNPHPALYSHLTRRQRKKVRGPLVDMHLRTALAAAEAVLNGRRSAVPTHDDDSLGRGSSSAPADPDARPDAQAQQPQTPPSPISDHDDAGPSHPPQPQMRNGDIPPEPQELASELPPAPPWTVPTSHIVVGDDELRVSLPPPDGPYVWRGERRVMTNGVEREVDVVVSIRDLSLPDGEHQEAAESSRAAEDVKTEPPEHMAHKRRCRTVTWKSGGKRIRTHLEVKTEPQ